MIVLPAQGRSRLVVAGDGDGWREDVRSHVVTAAATGLYAVGIDTKDLSRSAVSCMDARGAGWTFGGALVLGHRRRLPRSPSCLSISPISSRAWGLR